MKEGKNKEREKRENIHYGTPQMTERRQWFRVTSLTSAPHTPRSLLGSFFTFFLLFFFCGCFFIKTSIDVCDTRPNTSFSKNKKAFLLLLMITSEFLFLQPNKLQKGNNNHKLNVVRERVQKKLDKISSNNKDVLLLLAQ